MTRIDTLSDEYRAALPYSLVAPYNDEAEQTAKTLWEHGDNYTLDYDSATFCLKEALSFGLENCGSGRASWEICNIIKGDESHTDKLSRTWELYIGELCGNYTEKQIKNAWNRYNIEQKNNIRELLNDYLELCLDKLQGNY